MGWVILEMEGKLRNYGRDDIMGELWSDLGRLWDVRNGFGSNGGKRDSLKQMGFFK